MARTLELLIIFLLMPLQVLASGHFDDQLLARRTERCILNTDHCSLLCV